MSIMNYIRGICNTNKTANVAKERLQIIIAHERSQNRNPDYLHRLQQELIEVIAKYVEVEEDQVRVQLDRIGENSILELNITIPERSLAAQD
ncbi:MAG: cell division topological specificity factor MinE [Proteobacteria bacterium]|nr:cell division topological specificity factor MinE [Pseudomonadota bacterium]